MPDFNHRLSSPPHPLGETAMKLPELILELVKAGFTIGNTISADFNRTTLTRDSDNALASILSSDSESVWSLALFPDCNLDLPIVIKNKPFPTHDQIENILTTFATRIREARSTNTHFFHEPENCTCSGGTACRMICDGGLALCALCGHLEGSLTSDCPAIQTYSKYGDLVYAGSIDYRQGAWVEGVSSPYSPAHYRERSRLHS